MSDPEWLAEVQRWLRYAREALTAAEALLHQRAIVPRRHDLDALRQLIPDGWHLKTELPELATLTEWAVEARYPGDWPDATAEDALVAVQQARTVWQSVCTDLAHHDFAVDDIT